MWLTKVKFLVAATKNLFVVPNFVAVTKPFSVRSNCGEQESPTLMSLVTSTIVERKMSQPNLA